MSQRTRSRTITAGTARSRRTDEPPAPPSADAPLSAEALARTLRAVATEIERDPALARRLATALTEPARAPARRPARPASGAPELPAPVAAESPVTFAAPRRAPRVFTPRVVPGIAPELGPGIPDPFAFARQHGPEALRTALGELRRGTLRAMIREHGIASAARVTAVTDDDKLRAMIVAAVARA